MPKTRGLPPLGTSVAGNSAMLMGNLPGASAATDLLKPPLTSFPGSPGPHKHQSTRTPKPAAIVKFIERELQNRGCGPKPSIVRLGIYREAFSRLSASFGSYTTVLSSIQHEYEKTLKQQHVDSSELGSLRGRVMMYDQELTLTIANLKQAHIENTHELRQKLLASTTKNRMLNAHKMELTTQIARLSQEVYNVHQLLVQEKAARQLAIGYMAKPKGKTKKEGNSVAGGAETGAEDGNTSSPEGGDGASIDGESNGNGSEDGGEDTELLHAKIAELQAQNAAAVKEAKQSKQKAAEAEQQYKRLMEEHSILLSLQKKEKE